MEGRQRDSEAGSGTEERGFLRRTALAAGLVGLIGLLLLCVILSAQLWPALFGAVLLAIFLRGLSIPVRAYTTLSPRWSLGIVLLILLALLGLGGWLLAPGVAGQLDEFATRTPDLLQRAQELLQESAAGRRVLRLLQGGQDGGALFGRAAAFLSLSLRGLIYLVVVLVAGLYMALNPSPYVNGLVRLFPIPRRERVQQVLHGMGHALLWFLIGRAVSMLAVGVLTGVGLRLLGVPLAGALGVLAGALTFVPYAGPIAAAVPIGLVAAMEGVDRLLFTMLLYTGIQSIEGFLITPLVQERVVSLPPALTLAAEVFMGLIFGAAGIIISVPLAAALIVLIRGAYLEDALGEAPEDAPGAAQP